MARCAAAISAILILLFIDPNNVAGSAHSDAVERCDVTDIQFWSYSEYTRVVVSISGKTEFSRKRIQNPDRLFFDLKKSRIKKETATNLAVGNGMLKSVRAAQFDPETVRVVLDLEKIRDYKVIDLDDQIIIDVFGVTSSTPKKKKIIVLDPGHGGHDPGAVGPNGLYEKDVVLDIALKLKKLLAAEGPAEVHLTRDKDVFIPLPQRTAIANSKNADLFVSVHANASTRKNAHGIETYFLNWTDDEESMKVAARENRITLSQMKKIKGGLDDLDMILSDLKRDHKRDESKKLAHLIQYSLIDDLKRSYDHVANLKVKWALFYVLFGAQMPSVLVEVSFISNPVEEKYLSRDSYRKDIARSIASGIGKYLSAPDSGSVAYREKTLESGD